MLDAASSADMAAAAGSLSSIPPSATDPTVVTIAVAALETTMRPPLSVDVDVLLKLYRTSANANEVVRRQSGWRGSRARGGVRDVAPDREEEEQGLDG